MAQEDYVELGPEILTAMRSAAATARPHECCGILLGEAEEITGILPAANIHPTPQTHFEIDPAALIAAHRAARSNGPQVIGYYHSHPAGPPSPSATDRAHAAGDGRVWAIIGAGGDVRLWRDVQSGFTELSHRVIAR